MKIGIIEIFRLTGRKRIFFFGARAVLNVIDVLDRTPSAALSRSVELDVNHVEGGARTHTKKCGDRRL